MMRTGTRTAAQHLAEAAAALSWRDLPEDVQARTVTLFVDTLAVIAGGLDHPVYARFAELAAVDAGPCSLIGRADGVSVATAALIHGGATTILQMQDGHRVARGHPASAIVPLLLALAEASDYDIADVMTAFVAGYECGVRIGVALGGLQPAVHDVGNWATLGAAVAATHLLTGGDAAAMAEAIESAAAVALFPDSRSPVSGATAHHLYGGIGTVTALQVARGAAAGMTGVRGSLEQFFLPRAGAAPDAALLVAGIDGQGRFKTFEMLAGYLKRHPVCAHWSTTADALAGLLAAHEFAADDVEHVDLAVYGAAMNYNVDDPSNDLAARFSGRAIVAAMLPTGLLSPDAFSAAGLADPAFRARMSRVTVVHDPVLDAGYPAGRPMRITITLRDGRVLEAEASQPVGDGVEGLPDQLFAAKVAGLFSRHFGQKGQAKVSAALYGWLAGGSLENLSVALRGPVPS